MNAREERGLHIAATTKLQKKGLLWLVPSQYGYFMFHHEEFLQHYHKRSNVETVFSMIKSKFGDALRSKSDTAQENEALCKVLCHNIYCLIQAIYELNIAPVFWKDEARPPLLVAV